MSRPRTALIAAALAAGLAACGQPGEVPPPEPRNADEVDPDVSPAPADDIEPLEDR